MCKLTSWVKTVVNVGNNIYGPDRRSSQVPFPYFMCAFHVWNTSTCMFIWSSGDMRAAVYFQTQVKEM